MNKFKQAKGLTESCGECRYIQVESTLSALARFTSCCITHNKAAPERPLHHQHNVKTVIIYGRADS